MQFHLPRPIKMIRSSLHIKLLLSSLLVIALIMGFAVYALYLGHVEEQTQKASARMQENLAKLFSSTEPDDKGSNVELGRISRGAGDRNLDTLICRADGDLVWSSLHMPEVIKAKQTICGDLMKYLGGMDLDYFFKKHTIKNGESYFVYSLRFIRNPGSGTTAY
ncbi:MAG: ATP-binding protein, partial [Aeromonas veronii]